MGRKIKRPPVPISTFADIVRIVETGRELPPHHGPIPRRLLPAKNAIDILTRTHGGIVYLFNSRRFPPLAARSGPEYDFYVRMEVDLSVTAIVHQPMRLAWRDDLGVRHTHVPDAALIWDGRLTVVEIKTKQESLFTSVQARTAILKRDAAEHDVDYLVITEDWIRNEPYLANAKAMIQRPIRDYTANDIMSISALLSEHRDGLSEMAIANYLGQGRDYKFIVRALCADGVLVLADPDALFVPNGRFTLSGAA